MLDQSTVQPQFGPQSSSCTWPYLCPCCGLCHFPNLNIL